MIWIALASITLAGAGWIAVVALLVKIADLEDQKQDYTDLLKDAALENARLRLEHHLARCEAIAASGLKVVPIRSAKP